MNQQRKKNRKNPAWREAHRLRSHGFAAVLEKKSGEVVAQAHNGCFGRMAEIDRDIYDAWARGTLGAL